MKHKDSIAKQERIARRQAIKEASAKIGKPFLIYRMIGAVIDFLIMAILAVALQVLFSKTLYKPMGYYEAKDKGYQLAKTSGLYYEYENDLYQWDISYEEEATYDSMFDPIIKTYYTTEVEAINDGCLAKYNEAKEKSNLFDKVGDVYTLKSSAKESDIKDFYEAQYSVALDHFARTTDYATARTKVTNVFILTLTLNIFITSAIIYFIIPVSTKQGQTIGHFIFKICLLDSRDNSNVKKWQILVRYIAIVGLNIYMPLTLTVLYNLGVMAFAPLVGSIFLMCLTKENKAIHDYVSSSHVILKHRAGALDTLNQIIDSNKQR